MKEKLNNDGYRQLFKYQQNNLAIFRFKSIQIKNNTTTLYADEISGHGLRQAQKCCGIKPVKAISTLLPF